MNRQLSVVNRQWTGQLRARSRATRARHRRRLVLLAQEAVLANQELEVLALFLGELQEDLLAFRVLEPFAVALEEPV